MPWYDYWTELDLDDNPISYKDVEFEQAIVQTNAVKELNEIVKTISKRRQICWILGRRGTGKSQMLHWTIRQLFMNLDKSNSPPIMVTVLGKKKAD